MPSGTLPTYGYTPPNLPGVPAKMRSCSSRRGRAVQGGTFFRSIDVGRQSNNITVQIVTEDDKSYLIVTNQNLKFEENVQGKATVTSLDLTGSTFRDLVIIDSTNTAKTYSTSCGIALARQNGEPYTLPTPTTAEFTYDRVFSIPGKLSVQLTKPATPLSAQDTISIAPRFKIYELSTLVVPPVTDPATGTTTPGATGLDIGAMRTAVNAANTWLTMPERGTDKQDTGTDDLVGTAFAETNLSGADGLPDNPTIEKTGPSRSIIYVNYGEELDGSLGNVNSVYEWQGDDAQNGKWVPY